MTARKVLTELLVIALILCGLEGSYRVYKYVRYGMVEYPDALSIGYYETHPGYGVVPKKGFRSESIPPKLRNEPTLKVSFGSKYTANSLGFRGPETTVEKPAGVYRIAVIGDSTSLSLELNDEETWPAVLETLLQKDPDFMKSFGAQRVEVINASGGAWRVREGLLRFQEEVRPLRPDLLLVSLGWNDGFKGVEGIDPEKTKLPSKPWVRRVKILENLWIRTENMKSADKGLQEERRKRIARQTPWADATVRNLKEFDRLCRESGTKLALVDMPGLCRSGLAKDSAEYRAVTGHTRVTEASYPFYVELKQLVSGLLRESGAPVIDVHGQFDSLAGPQRTALFMDEMHTSAPGAAEIAKAVHKGLKTL